MDTNWGVVINPNGWWGELTLVAEEFKAEKQRAVLDIFFVFENWAINYRKDILQQMKTAPEAKKREQMEELALLDFFLKRRGKDLGFSTYAYSEIHNEPDIRITINRKILEILSKLADSPQKFREQLNQGAIHFKFIDPFRGAPDLFEPQNLETIMTNTQATRNYANNRIDASLKEGDLDDVQATLSFLMELEGGPRGGYDLLKHHSRQEGSFYRETYFYQMQEYIHRHIRYVDLYIAPPDLRLMSLMSIGAGKLRDFIETTLTETLGAMEQDLVLFYKLVTDLLSISSAIWFLSKPRTEQLMMLNRTYSLDSFLDALIQAFMERATKPSWIPSVSQALDMLFNRGYYSEHAQILQTLIAKTEHLEKKQLYFSYIELATAYRQLGDHETALKYYLTANQYISYLDAPAQEKTYRKNICLIRIAEESRQLGNEDPWKEYVVKINDHLKNLSDINKGRILGNLAGTSQRLLDFKAEEYFLSQALDYLPEQLAGDVQRRLEVLYEAPFSSRSLNHEWLVSLEIQAQFEKLKEFGTHALAAFNLQKAIEHFTNTVQLVQKSKSNDLRIEALELLVYAFYHSGEANQAKKCYLQLLQLDETNLTGLSFYTILTLTDNTITNPKQALHQVSRQINEQNYLEFVQRVMYHLMQIRESMELEKDLKVLDTVLSIDPDLLYLDIGIMLADYGMTRIAISCFETALQLAQEASRRADILANIGSVYANLDKHKEAIAWYMQALEDNPCNAYTYINIASSYGYLLDFTPALKYVKCAIELAKETPALTEYVEKLRDDAEFYETMRKQRFNFNKIPSDKIRVFLKTGDRSFFEGLMVKEMRELDASPIIVSYGKALQTMLHEQISSVVLEYVKTQLGGRFPSLAWQAAPRTCPIKLLYLRQIPLSLGAWKLILQPKSGQNVDTLNQWWKQFIETQMDPTLIPPIYEACNLLTPERNPASHTKLVPFEEAANLRAQIVEVLNQVIDVLY